MGHAESEADLWEIAENLHRAELTGIQRSLQTGLWIKLKDEKIKRDQRENIAPGEPTRRRQGSNHPRDEGIRAAGRELGIPRATATRAVRIATHLTPTAQKAAAHLGLDEYPHRSSVRQKAHLSCT